mmetsp:Transcript_1729/g.3239  ORF Transcript_1729/g.3239 Transcript_1729/m.3239 type:complete len:765 (+) Transcript_1729:642-2936(+)
MACEFGCVEIARLLIDKGCNYLISDHLGRTPLHKAAEFDQTSCVRLLIEKGANKETQDKAYYTPLLTACEHGSSLSAEALISLGANLEAVEGNGKGGLHIAATKGHKSVIHLLLTCAATIETKDNEGCTPVFYACKFRKLSAIVELIRWGADVGVKSAAFMPFQLVDRKDKPFPDQILHRAPGLKELYRSKMNDIHQLVEYGKVRFILEHFNLRDNIALKDSYGETPLHYAARLGKEEIVTTFLDLGCQMDCVDNWGYTPIHCACEGNHVEIVKIFLQRGIDVEICSTVGKTPLHRACEYGHVDVVKILLSYSADATRKDVLGRSPIHYAASSKNLDMLVLMLNYGTDALLTDGNGETILHHACKLNDEKLLKLLLSREGDEIKNNLDVQDDLGKTPLLHAAEKGNYRLVKLLLKARAKPDVGNKWNAVGLHYACANGHLHTAVTILKASLLRPPSGKLMSTLRHTKCKLFDENVDMVNLLKEECCINNVDDSGETPLFKACYRGHINIVRALLERGADYTIKAGDFFPFDLLKRGKTFDEIERLGSKVSRFIVRVKYENSIDVEKTDVLDLITAPKAKKAVLAVNELTSDADRALFNKNAVITPEDFDINLRDISNKLRLLSLRRLDIIKESKALCAGPYLYHKDLKKRVIQLIEEGLEAYNNKNYAIVRDKWEMATQLQCLKDWVAVTLLRDKPMDREASDRLYDILRLFEVYQTKKHVTHSERLQLRSRAECTLKVFDNKDIEYDINIVKKKKKKKKKGLI